LGAASLFVLPVAAPIAVFAVAALSTPLADAAHDKINHMYDPESRMLGQ
jgi:hypothetical protein